MKIEYGEEATETQGMVRIDDGEWEKFATSERLDLAFRTLVGDLEAKNSRIDHAIMRMENVKADAENIASSLDQEIRCLRHS
jgi:hypothetical protein